jgi:GDP-4-dehydro-6-deoxy-D-mannose reductase
MRVLVTGAKGFVGARLVPRLRQAGHDVAPFDQDLDVSDAPRTLEAVGDVRPDALVHLAAVSSVADSFGEAPLVYRVNYLGARSVLEALRRAAPRARLILVGSGEQYGSAAPGDPPFTESSPLRPGSPYARSKAAADLLGAAHAARGLSVVRVRPFTHTGPGQSDRFAASSFARQIAQIEAGRQPPLLRVGTLEAIRDYLDVDDVIDAYLRLLAPEVPASVYNVARGSGISLRRILELLLRNTSTAPRIEVDPERQRPADALVGDAQRLQRVTGWQARIPLEDTLARLLDDWRVRVNGS